MKGSKALLKMLEDRGVSSVFGYPGATVIPIYDEFLESNVRHILVRHEQCAAHMADGYARATGTPESVSPPADPEPPTWSPESPPPMRIPSP